MLSLLLRYERFLYLLLLVGLLLFIRRAWLAWNDLRSATFRLEEEHARQRLQQSVIGTLLSATLMLFLFMASALGGASPAPAEPVPQSAATPGTGTPPAALDTPTPALPAVEEMESRCDPQRVFIAYPEDGAEIQGEIDIRGTASIENFGFYKVEFAPADQPLFLTIEVGRVPKVDDVLVQAWDTTMLPAGEYLLQLVVVDNTGQPLPPCRVRVRVKGE
ncbi:MAG: hypothetical protein GXO37_03995 [Chloroflexi bacterium]|nr:hypothetical protein [Chloroflexota bacterium]